MKKIFILLLCVYQLQANNLTKVSLQLSWFNQFQFAGYYIAKEKGFYKDAGFEVEIKPFSFEENNLENVLSKKVDFSIAREAIFTEKNAEKILSLYPLFQTSPLVLLSKKSSNINSVKDFDNKTMMITTDDASEVSLKAMIKSTGINLDSITYLNHTHNIDDLINGKTDLISAYLSKAPFELEQKGIKYNIFQPKEYGFDLYSDFLYTSKEFAANNKEMVKRFKEASLKGWQYAYEHIDEAVELILQNYNTQNLTKDELLFEAKVLKELSYYNTNTLGNIDKNSVQRVYDLYNILGIANPNINIKRFALYDTNIPVHKRKLELLEYEKEYLQEKQSIKVCVLKENAPFFSINKKNEKQGIVKDIFDLVKKRTNLHFEEIFASNWQENLDFIKTRKCDMLYFAAKTKQREAYLDFTKPYMQVPYVVVTSLEKPFVSDIEQIKDKTLLLIEGDAYIGILKNKYPKINIITAQDQKEVISLLRSKKVYAYIGALTMVSYNMQKEAIVDLKISGKLSKNLSLSIATRSDEPLLSSIMNKALELVSEEEKRKINNSWTLLNVEPKVDYTLIFQIITIVAILLFIGLFFYFKLKRLNKKLESSLYNFEYLFNYTIEAIILFQDNKCIDINLAALKLFEFKDKQSAIGLSSHAFIEKEHVDFDLENFELQNEEAYEISAIKQNKKSFPILVNNKFTYINDKFTRIFLCIDLSELKNKENIIIQQSKISAVGEMLGNIAHQWRQPLSTISIMASNLRVSLELEEDISKEELFSYVQSTTKQCQYLSKTIDDFRSFLSSELEVIEKVNLVHSIKKVESLVSDSYKNNHIKIIYDVQECFIKANESKLIQALLNIFNNAKDVLKSRNINTHDRFLFVSLKKHKKSIKLSIKDSAGGVTKENLNKIFEPYFTTKDDSQGTGIGLYITHQIITTHLDAQIYVQNSEFSYNGKNYRGAEFVITFD